MTDETAFSSGARDWDNQTAETRKRLIKAGKWSPARERRYQSIYGNAPADKANET